MAVYPKSFHRRSFTSAPMKRIARAAMLSLALGCPALVWSLDLKQAAELALTEDARLRAARSTALAAEEKIPQARAQLLPSVTLQAAENRNQLRSIPQTGAITHNNYTSDSRGVTARMPILRRALTVARDQADVQVEDARATLDASVQELHVRLATHYLDALLAEEQVGLLAVQRTNVEAQLDGARKALVAGSGIRTDVDLAQARLDQVLALELEARQNVGYMRRMLQSIVNRPVPQLPRVDGEGLSRAIASTTIGDLDMWVERAIERSPEVRSLRARVASARFDLERAKTNHWPTLDVVASWTYSRSDSVTSLNSAYEQKSVGLQLNVPIYSGGYMTSVERQMAAQHTSALDTLDAGLREVRLTVEKEYRGVTEGVAKVRALEQAVASARISLDSTRKSFAAGFRTVLHVLDAEQALRQSEFNLSQARYAYLAAYIRLRGYSGEAAEATSEVSHWLSGAKSSS